MIGNRIPNAHSFERIFLVFGTDIHPEVFHLQLSAAFFTTHHMNGFAADDTSDDLISVMDVQPQAGEQVHVESAQRFEVKVTAFIYVIDQETDLVCMTHHHHFQVATAAFECDQVAVDIGGNFIRIGSHKDSGNLLSGSLKAGGAVGLNEVSKEFQVFLFHLIAPLTVVCLAVGKGIQRSFDYRFLVRDNAQKLQHIITGIVK